MNIKCILLFIFIIQLPLLFSVLPHIILLVILLLPLPFLYVRLLLFIFTTIVFDLHSSKQLPLHAMSDCCDKHDLLTTPIPVLVAVIVLGGVVVNGTFGCERGASGSSR